MEANRTHQAPPVIEDLGDGTFYYNFNVLESEGEDGSPSFDYNQVRCAYPVDETEIQQSVNDQNYQHLVVLSSYEKV